MRKIIVIAAAAALAGLPVAATASPQNTTEFNETVGHEDLDLTTSEGASRLDERIRTKVRQLCRIGGRDSASIQLERECRSSALAAALPQARLAVAQANADRARLATRSTASQAATPGV